MHFFHFSPTDSPSDVSGDKDMHQEGAAPRSKYGRHYIYAETARLDFVDIPFNCSVTNENVLTTVTHHSKDNINVVSKLNITPFIAVNPEAYLHLMERLIFF